jgi:hypothetical protein
MARKTYWHLEAARRVPSDYEIATSRLLYHVSRGGFAVNVPTSAFYARNQMGSPLSSNRWDDFADPRATTYTKYVELQRDAEGHVNRLLASAEELDYEKNLAPGWLESFGRILSPLRFLYHGLQMVAAYVGQMAPSSRIVVTALFQCGDEVRRIQRIAYRLAQLGRSRPSMISDGRAIWQSDPKWQPLRRVLEQLLVTYDWGEALVALNLCVKPTVDDLFLTALAARSDESEDHIDAQILRSLFEDSRWHRAWTDALLALAFRDNGSNKDVVARWVDVWAPRVEECALGAAGILGIDSAPVVAAAMTRLRPLNAPARSRMVSLG